MTHPPPAQRIRLGIDTGGTFTDLVASMGDQVVRLKVPSTPTDPGQAILDAISALEARLGHSFRGPVRHGTTVATNALLERRGARVVFITNAGFEDLLHLRRQARPDLYALHPSVPPPLVDAADTLGIPGRLGPDGTRIEPLGDLDTWADAHREILDTADVFAICLLHAYVNGEDEAALARCLEARYPERPVTCSHVLAPVFREYERASTTAVNAYLLPTMAGYLGRLVTALGPDRPLTVMGSAGGLLSHGEAQRHPVHTVLSGPAGGVVGAWRVGQRSGRNRLLTLDMGGTSTDVSVIVGTLTPEDEAHLAEHPLRVPLLPIETVGAGGGSIAYLDAGGILRVGPESAGARPGPACYGHAGAAARPTVTDANVVLGRLTTLLGGAFPLDVHAAQRAVDQIAAPLEVDVETAARAIVEVAEANMARACKRVTMERGIDPRTLVLVAFGGAGGLHACALADALGCPEVLFPAEPGVLSAEGIVSARHVESATRTLMWTANQWAESALAEQMQEVRASLGTPQPETDAQWLLDCRYDGQTFTLPVPLDDAVGPIGLRALFEALHRERFGYALPAKRPITLVSLRLFLRPREAPIAGADVLDSPAIRGPQSIGHYSATLWLPEGWSATRLDDGGLVCQRVEAAVEDPRQENLALALEIHRLRLAAIAEEMGASLKKAAFSTNIKERRDYSCAVFDARGQMLVHAAHIPVHLGSTPASVRAALDAGVMAQGHTAILNDPFAGGTHLPDVTIVSPVHLASEAAPTFYVANRAHHADVGGLSPGSLPAPRRPDGSVRPLTIDDEGVRVPPRALTEETRHAFASASRTPDERIGDLRAQEAANHVGAERLRGWVEVRGEDEILRQNDALLAYSERRMRALIADLPDGVYTHEAWLDDDGVRKEPVRIHAAVTIEGDQVVVDFSASADSVAGPLNAVRAIAVSAVFYVFRCLGGASIPANAGLMRPIEIRTRTGSVVDAEPPAAVSAGNVETSQRIVDTLLGALAKAAPHRVPAAACGTMNNVLFGGPLTDDKDGAQFVHYETLGGGAGGGPEGPGASGIQVHMTNTLNTPVESIEQAFPVRITHYGLTPPASPSPDGHPGGRGIIRRYEFLSQAEVSLITDRRVTSPFGLNGAPAGTLGRNTLITSDGVRHPLPGKASLTVNPGDALEVQTPTGGGWRPPPSD